MREAARIVGLAFTILGAFSIHRHMDRHECKMIDLIFLFLGVAFSMMPLAI